MRGLDLLNDKIFMPSVKASANYAFESLEELCPINQTDMFLNDNMYSIVYSGYVQYISNNRRRYGARQDLNLFENSLSTILTLSQDFFLLKKVFLNCILYML